MCRVCMCVRCMCLSGKTQRAGNAAAAAADFPTLPQTRTSCPFPVIALLLAKFFAFFSLSFSFFLSLSLSLCANYLSRFTCARQYAEHALFFPVIKTAVKTPRHVRRHSSRAGSRSFLSDFPQHCSTLGGLLIDSFWV